MMDDAVTPESTTPPLAATIEYSFLNSNADLSGVDRFDGICQGSNLAFTRQDAFRCAVEGYGPGGAAGILDPCFAREFLSTELLCVDTPTDILAVVEFTEEGPGGTSLLPAEEALPWFITLADGTGCKASEGMVDLIADTATNYRCRFDQVERYLALPIDKSGDIWTIRCTDTDLTRLLECDIKEVWN